MNKRFWLERKCPVCGRGPQWACVDEKGYLSNPHDERLQLEILLDDLPLDERIRNGL